VIARAWRRLIARPRGPRLLVAIACALVVAMYASNCDLGGGHGLDPDAPRGDGVYRPVIARGDGHLLYLMARSTALDGDWVFDNDLARFGDPWHAPITPTGRKAIIHPIGPALVWTPLIWLAEGGAVAANVAGADIPLHGYTLWTQWIVFLSSALFGCGAVLIGRRVATRVIGGRWAPSYGAAAVLLGTPLTYYATYMPSYAHAMDACACAAFLGYWALTVGRRDANRSVWLGVLLGVAMLIRVQELALGIVVLIEALSEVRTAARWRVLALGGLTLVVAVAMFTPQLLEWQRVFGTVSALPQGAKYTRPGAPMIAELLWSPRNGWFSTTPIAYAGVIGLWCLPRRARVVQLGLLAAVAIQVYLCSTILDWWGGAAFGQRRLCNVTLPLVVGLAALLWRLGRLAARASRIPPRVWHELVALVFGCLVWWNLERVERLRGGKPASPEVVPSCCDDVAPHARPLVEPIYDAIGDPFEFPANAWFALAHHVSLRAWDELAGRYPLVPPMAAIADGADELFAATPGWWRPDTPLLDAAIVGGMSQVERADRPFRWTIAPAATILIPNLMPYGQRFTVWIASGGAHHVVLRWNGARVAEQDVGPSWTAVAFELPEVALHTNELTIEAPLGPVPPRAEFPPAPAVAGVAVGHLDVAFVRAK
jgi:hypothetical protein